MTTTYDPKHPVYLDEADVRTEMARVHDVCHGCRRCTSLCGAFPRLFEMLDAMAEPDAGMLTPAQQDDVVDRCHQCKLCALDCPFRPGVHEAAVDVPRLMLRADAMRLEHGHATQARRTTQILGRPDLVGKVATRVAPLANRVVEAEPGSLVRRLNAKITGVSSVRLLTPYARERFSTWFRNRPRIHMRKKQAVATVFPTCMVEYQETGIGRDLVRVYERNGIECTLTEAGCCGAPWLHAGDVKRFADLAEKNTRILAAEVRAGTDVVVPQPTCSYVLKYDVADHVSESLRADAELVAEHTYDAAHYLMTLHRGDDYVLDTHFDGDVPTTITYHAPCHLRAQDNGYESRDLLRLTGARVRLVRQCSGVDGLWGLRAQNEALALPLAEALGEQVDRLGSDAVAGDCHLANTAIVERTGATAQHPLQIMARAYGIADDGS